MGRGFGGCAETVAFRVRPMVNITPASSGIIQEARDEKDSLKEGHADSRIAQSGNKVLNRFMCLKRLFGSLYCGASSAEA